MNFDLGKFKKIREDNHIAVLRHPEGHEIKVSKASLTPRLTKQLSQLKNHMADGGLPEDISLDQPMGTTGPGQPSPEPSPMFTPSGQPAIPPQPQVPPSIPTQPRVDQVASIPSNYPLSSSRKPGSTTQMGDFGLAGMTSGFGQEARGIREEAAAKGGLGQSEAQAADKYAADTQKVMADHQKVYQHLNDEIGNTIRDIDAGHIDPNHYMNSKSDVGRVSTAIGLILGGIGGGLTHQENPALKFLNNQIDRDVAAQRDNLGKKQNILNAYFKQTGDLNAATAMTKAFYTDLYANQIRKAGAVAQTPMAKAEADKAAGQLQIQKAQTLAPLSIKAAVLGNTQNGAIDPSVAVRFLVPEHEQAAAYKELQTAQNMAKQKDNLSSAFDELNKINTVGNRVAHVGFEPDAVKAIREPLLAQLVKDSEGRITPTDVEMLRTLFPAPGNNAGTVAIKKQRLDQFINEKMNFPMLKAYGIQTPKPAARQNPNTIPGYKE